MNSHAVSLCIQVTAIAKLFISIQIIKYSSILSLLSIKLYIIQIKRRENN